MTKNNKHKKRHSNLINQSFRQFDFDRILNGTSQQVLLLIITPSIDNLYA